MGTDTTVVMLMLSPSGLAGSGTSKLRLRTAQRYVPRSAACEGPPHAGMGDHVPATRTGFGNGPGPDPWTGYRRGRVHGIPVERTARLIADANATEFTASVCPG